MANRKRSSQSRPGGGANRSKNEGRIEGYRAKGGAARTGGVRRPGEVRSPYSVAKAEKGLGGQQIEGRQAVRELLVAGTRKVYEVWISAELKETEVIADIVALAKSQRVQVHEVARKKLEAEARSEAPQGVLAKAAELPETPFEQLVRRRPGKAPFLIAVDGVTDPGNLGALIRSADGAGADGVVLPRHRAVHVTPTVAKAAAGAVEHVPMAIVGGLPSAIATIKKAGIWVVGLDDAADRSLFELGDLAVEGICLVLGAEGAGLSRLARERCDMIVSIPMRGRLSSLNVSAAAALACYEVTRQRLAARGNSGI
ncbi:MAG: 23S rRNA (guanosine(2251)-2'-O)-methyltransferase RlmB [Ilumatobacteraceae bacterium]